MTQDMSEEEKKRLAKEVAAQKLKKKQENKNSGKSLAEQINFGGKYEKPEENE